jgi:6-phosphofructokinase 1
VLAPKTIDNDLGVNYPSEPDEWARVNDASAKGGFRYKRTESRAVFDIEHIVNYVTPGYATAVFVSAGGVERIRTTAESHRRIAIIEVMGRHSATSPGHRLRSARHPAGPGRNRHRPGGGKNTGVTSCKSMW